MRDVIKCTSRGLEETHLSESVSDRWNEADRDIV